MLSTASASIRATCRHFHGRRIPSKRPVIALMRRAVLSKPDASVISVWRGAHTSSSIMSPLVAFNLPDVGERITTVVITEWLVKEGDTVEMGDAICEVQSDKSAATVYSPYDGVVKELVVAEEETAYLEKPIVVFEVEDDINAMPDESPEPSVSSSAESASESTITTSSSPPTTSGKVLATPAVRHLATEKGVTLADVVATGKGGRVVKEDILNYIERQAAPVMGGPVMPSVTPSPPSLPSSPSAEDHVEPITGFKKVMVRTMTESGRIPQFGYKDEINMDQLVQLRSLLKPSMDERNIAFSYMPVLIKAVSLALKYYPILNSTVDPDCTAITYRADHNVGVAMDTPLGLIVPNVKRVQEKSVFEIAVELNRLQELGAVGQIPPADTTDGTFSLSNIGAIGGTYTNPMLLPPSVAIGAFGRVQVVPRFDSEGDLERGHVMHVSWAADHRVIDGAELARFSNHWKSMVENPVKMILEMK